MLAVACLLSSFLLLDPALGQEETIEQGQVLEQEEVSAYQAAKSVENDYLDAIDLIESDYGPYATELSDLYLGLGQTLMNNQDFEEARDAFNRGVMVVRVNSGPNSPEQTNHLYLIANVETMLGEFSAADKVLRNIYFINTSYYGEDSPELLPVLDRMYKWYSVMRPPGALTMDYMDYETTIELTDEMVRISEEVNGENHPENALAYRRLADAEFQMARHLTGSGMALNPKNYVAATSGSLQPMTLGSEPVMEHYVTARKAYKQYLDALVADKSTTPIQYAKALADLADWYLLFDKFKRSRDLYEQGYQILAQSKGYAEQAESFMKYPQPMHFIAKPQADLPEELHIEFKEESLDISMTVSTYGKASYVEVIDPPEDMPKQFISEIKKLVRETPFRPAIKAGEVVKTKEFIWQFPIVLQESAS